MHPFITEYIFKPLPHWSLWAKGHIKVIFDRTINNSGSYLWLFFLCFFPIWFLVLLFGSLDCNDCFRWSAAQAVDVPESHHLLILNKLCILSPADLALHVLRYIFPEKVLHILLGQYVFDNWVKLALPSPLLPMAPVLPPNSFKKKFITCSGCRSSCLQRSLKFLIAVLLLPSLATSGGFSIILVASTE